MSNEKPDWLPAAQDFCKNARIEICAWGTDTLVVKAESENRAEDVAAQLRSLGFEPIQDEDDSEAGLLTMSRNPAATRTRQPMQVGSTDISQRPKAQRVAVLFEIVPVLLVAFAIWHGVAFPIWFLVALSALALWDASRVLLWKLQLNPPELRVRRYFQWKTVPWSQIRSVEVGATWGRGQEAVRLTLGSGTTLNLGAFGFVFARLLRDRLREELKRRQGQSQ